MSFDLVFQPCRFDGSTVMLRNPFTHEMTEEPRNAPLVPEELAAVRALLQRACPRGPDEHECWPVVFPDGGHAEVYGSELEQGCMVSLRGMTPDLVAFLYDVLVAGNWVLMGEEQPIAASPAAIQGTPEDFGEPVFCTSARELGRMIAGDFEAWEKYRDQVCGET